MTIPRTTLSSRGQNVEGNEANIAVQSHCIYICAVLLVIYLKSSIARALDTCSVKTGGRHAQGSLV